MASRPIFIPRETSVGVIEKMIDFKWHPGMATTQKQKSINELHREAKKFNLQHILEISSKSQETLGIKLSAFNLQITTKKNKNKLTVETAFQGSKVFEVGGPYTDLYGLDSAAAKKDIRLKESGNIVKFIFFGQVFPITPRTYFYDWIYINALVQNHDLVEEVLQFDGFSDIEFNPKKSINCQAHAAALFLSLSHHDLLLKAIESPESFLNITSDHYTNQKRNIAVQGSFI